MSEQPLPICYHCKLDLDSKGYAVTILKGSLFHRMSCIYCGAETKHLGTIEKANVKGKVALATS